MEDLFHLTGALIQEKYEIVAPVAVGGFSVVYRGLHRHLDQPVAIKVLKIPPHFEAEGRRAFVERFCEEGKILCNLADHPSIVRVHDYGTHDHEGQSLFYLILEWLVGKDLASLLGENRPAFDVSDAIALIRPAIEALALAHSQGIAHRDLKPANLFLAETKLGMRIKVLDFGIAKAMQEGELAQELTAHTRSGLRAFTPPYGAPEQFRPKKYGATGPWTDVHAMGLILTELVAGRPAMQGDDEAECMLLATADQRPTPRAAGAGVSDEFEAICRKALPCHPETDTLTPGSSWLHWTK